MKKLFNHEMKIKNWYRQMRLINAHLKWLKGKRGLRPRLPWRVSAFDLPEWVHNFHPCNHRDKCKRNAILVLCWCMCRHLNTASRDIRCDPCSLCCRAMLFDPRHICISNAIFILIRWLVIEYCRSLKVCEREIENVQKTLIIFN